MIQSTVDKLDNMCIGAKEVQLGSTLRSIQSLLKGDMLFVLTPATVATPHYGTKAWTRVVEVALKDSLGNYMTWFDGDVTISIGDTSTAGTASIVSTTLTLVQGRANVVVSGDLQAWIATETDTLTVAAKTINGVVCATKTSVETLS